MGYEIAKLVVQSSSAAYSPVKDMFSYFNDKAKYVRDLEDNLTKLVEERTTFYSKKKQIDRILATSVSKEKSGEYNLSVAEIQVFEIKYNKFIKKYHKHCNNLPNVIPELPLTESKEIDQKQIVLPEPDALNSHNVIDALQSSNPTILTRKFFKLAQLSKDINKLHGHISRATGRMKPENAMLEKEVQPVQVKRGDIDVPSFSVHVNKVLRYLREDENKRIGIMGPIGVGKTTVMKMLNNQLKETSSAVSNGDISLKFDVVIWINYSKHLDADKNIEMMQDVIMERLKLIKEKANSIEQNADIISTALSNKKYIMLIDQVFTFELNDVGIYIDHRFGKVVVASSNHKCIRQMADQQVEIRPMSNNDALDLFQKVCGKIYDPRIKDLADKIIESCGGLPLVIKLVATYLKGVKDEDVWSRVKHVLQSETKSANLLKLGGVGNAYKLVYDKLEENHMKCLLFVALFPSDQKINKNYLVECWKAERFLESDNLKLRSARECGATVLKELSDQYLLEPCLDNHVKMPVYFRKVALEQQYPGEEDYVVWVSEKNKLLSADHTWKTTRRMSLICSKSKLPESPESDIISTLLLQLNPELVALGDTFFLKMQNLRILDLNQTGIESLPSSISSLINLICLYLNDCSQLAELPPKVNLLKKLEVLDIRGTSIRILPKEIGEMLQLRCLRISFSQKGCNRKSKGKAVEMKIHLDIISRLQQLEELTIETGCCFQGWNVIAGQIACELSKLENLSSLNFHFPSVCSLEKFVVDGKSWRNTDTHLTGNNFRSFKISIGCCETKHPYGSDISGILAERLLRFSTNSADLEEISSVKEVLSQASAFELVGHSHLKSLSELALEKTGSLKVCIVERCKSLITVVEESAGALLQCLEKLHLFDLQFLQYIWKGSVSPGSLSNLKVLTLCGCPELTEILNHELAKALSCLKRIKVEDCSKIVEIIKVQSSDNVDLSDILPKVKTIELVNLPELRSICSTSSIQWKSLRRIMALSCCKLRNLSLTLTNAAKLETIKCEGSWWAEVQLTEEEERHFQPHCDFIVLEQSSAIRTFYEGEPSGSHGRSVIPQAPDNTDAQTHIGEIEETLSHNGFVASNIDAKAEIGAENPVEKILRKAKFGSSSHQTSMVQAKVK